LVCVFFWGKFFNLFELAVEVRKVFEARFKGNFSNALIVFHELAAGVSYTQNDLNNIFSGNWLRMMGKLWNK
jgi:hypothetical protein